MCSPNEPAEDLQPHSCYSSSTSCCCSSCCSSVGMRPWLAPAVTPVMPAPPTAAVPAPTSTPTLASSPSPAPPSASSSLRLVYVFDAARPLPTLDLSRTVVSLLFGAAADHRFISWIRRYYLYVVRLFRMGSLLFPIVLVLTEQQGRVIAALVLASCIPALVCSIGLMSTDMFLLLLRHHEFLVSSLLNILNWVILMVILHDARAIAVFSALTGIQLALASDALFRTVASFFRTMLISVPALVSVGVLTFLQRADSMDAAMVLRVGLVRVQLVDVFLNSSVTMAVFAARVAYCRRSVLSEATANLIGCVIVRCKLQLRPHLMTRGAEEGRGGGGRRTEARGAWAGERSTPQHLQGLSMARVREELAARALATIRRATRTEVVPMDHAMPGKSRLTTQSRANSRASPRLLTTTSDRTRTWVGHRRSVILSARVVREQQARSVTTRSAMYRASFDPLQPHCQPLHAVPFALRSVEASATLWPRVTRSPTSPRVPLWLLLCVHACGCSGLVLTIASVLVRLVPVHLQPREEVANHVLPLLGLLLSVVFLAPVVAHFQRAMLATLLRNFDVLFLSWQLVTGSLALATMLAWDARCWNLLTWNLWLHATILLDALPPHARQQWMIRKRMAGGVILALLVCLSCLVVALAMNSATIQMDRALFRICLGRGRVHNVTAESYVVNRVIPVLAWSVRLVWELLVCPEHELVFLRTTVEYYCPMEMFPPSVNRSRHWGATARVLVNKTRSSSTRVASCTQSRRDDCGSPNESVLEAGERASMTSSSN